LPKREGIVKIIAGNEGTIRVRAQPTALLRLQDARFANVDLWAHLKP
jgi:hypothetical protein